MDRTGPKRSAPMDGQSSSITKAARTNACPTITVVQTFSRLHSIRTWDYFLSQLTKPAQHGKQLSLLSRLPWVCGSRAGAEASSKGTINFPRFEPLIQLPDSDVGSTSIGLILQVLL